MGFFSSPKTKIKVVDPFKGTGIRELYQQLNQMFTPMSEGLTPYGGGQIVPGASPLQQAGFGAAQGLTPLATGGQQYFGEMLGQTDPSAPQRYMGQAEQGLQGQMQPFDPSMAMQTMEPARQLGMQTYKEDVVPWIMERYGPAMGSKETGAMGRELAKGGERLGLGLSAQLAPMLFAGEQAQLGRQANIPGQFMNLAGLPGQVLGQAGQIGGMGANLLGQQMNIGGIQRGITAEQMQEPYMRFQQPYSQQQMQLLQMALGQPGKEVVAQQQGAGLGYSMLAGGAQGAGMAAGYALMASDKRLKENFEKIDNALQKVHQLEGQTYNFKSENKRSAGIIAQDVENVLPESVIEKDDVKYIEVNGVLALLVNAVKELSDEVLSIKKRASSFIGV